MNVHLLPHKISIFVALGAFGVAWGAGLLNDVPIHVIALRAVVAGALFWALGLVGGRLILDGICDAYGEQAAAQEQSNKAQPGGRK